MRRAGDEPSDGISQREVTKRVPSGESVCTVKTSRRPSGESSRPPTRGIAEYESSEREPIDDDDDGIGPTTGRRQPDSADDTRLAPDVRSRGGIRLTRARRPARARGRPTSRWPPA